MKNVLNFGRRKSCEEKQALFASSRESSKESNAEESEDDDGNRTETENIFENNFEER